MCVQPFFSSRFLTPSLAGMAGDDMVMMFVVRCPLGDQCSKKHGILAKKCTAEEARAALSWHLTSSPYHRLSEEEAENMAEETEVEEWPEPTGTTPQQQDEAPWQQSRKRQRTVEPQCPDMLDLAAEDGWGAGHRQGIHQQSGLAGVHRLLETGEGRSRECTAVVRKSRPGLRQ